MSREALLESYKRTFSPLRKDREFGGRLTDEQVRNGFERMIVVPQEEEVERYKIHGIAKIPLDPCRSIIDTECFQGQPPKHAWISKSGSEELVVIISSGKQTASHGAIEIDQKRNLEGLVVSFYFKVSPTAQIPYQAKLGTLYSEDNPS